MNEKIKGALSAVFIVMAVGCSTHGTKEQMPTVTETPPLEVPPGLVLPKKNHSMDLPEEGSESEI